MLNGRAFPYALRESLITVAPNQKVKLRVLNGHTETMALHIHGHKASSPTTTACRTIRPRASSGTFTTWPRPSAWTWN
ncbi:hypothetical protein [Methylogaea oryzae]|uniref:hypothetical protein n=1 Tax=Methylogaea oryzae TaxID=1295382 RepID=UPI00278C4301|nr:hypothetical protein [Methylogaea oryzae]